VKCTVHERPCQQHERLAVSQANLRGPGTSVLPDPMPVTPIDAPLDVVVSLPGSKSMTNRALVCAALAAGSSTLTNALHADDTEAMVDGLRAMGAEIDAQWPAGRLDVTGTAGRPISDVAIVDARLSGTTSRFLLPVAGLGEGHRRIDAANRMRERPMAEVIEAVRALGAEVHDIGAPGHLPVEVIGGTLVGGEVAVRGDVSSQFLSGLLLAAPAMRTGLVARLVGELVSEPYVDMTVAVMAGFGVAVQRPDRGTWVVEPQAYLGTDLVIEPDASTASYVFAAAALVGGRATVTGLGDASLQGDLAFVDVLERMGASVERDTHSTSVTGSGTLRGIDVDMSQLSDTAPTVAVVAAFADGPTRVTGIGFIRGKETDRVGNVVTELRRLGIDADEEPDGFTIRPRPLRPATVQTYDDHRMAMAFALAGLRFDGVQVADPGCVAKTFPGYWHLLDELRAPSPAGAMVRRP
jgi:3-phosphoshikimate 1-carboxyvinyltransferase